MTVSSVDRCEVDNVLARCLGDITASHQVTKIKSSVHGFSALLNLKTSTSTQVDNPFEEISQSSSQMEIQAGTGDVAETQYHCEHQDRVISEPNPPSRFAPRTRSIHSTWQRVVPCACWDYELYQCLRDIPPLRPDDVLQPNPALKALDDVLDCMPATLPMPLFPSTWPKPKQPRSEPDPHALPRTLNMEPVPPEDEPVPKVRTVQSRTYSDMTIANEKKKDTSLPVDSPAGPAYVAQAPSSPTMKYDPTSKIPTDAADFLPTSARKPDDDSGYGDSSANPTEVERGHTMASSANETSNDNSDHRVALVKILSFSHDTEHDPSYAAGETKTGYCPSLYDFVYSLRYRHDVSKTQSGPNDLPELVVSLGHLLIQGQDPEDPYSASWTPSWFVLVVDIGREEKPVWLVRDVRYLGWKKETLGTGKSRDDWTDPASDDEDLEGCKQADLMPPVWETKVEHEAQEFFRSLEKYSMIKVFSQLEDWTDHRVGATGVLSALTNEANVKNLEPRLYVVGKESSCS